MNRTVRVRDSVNLIRPFAKQKALFYLAVLIFAGSVLANQPRQTNDDMKFEGESCSISAIVHIQNKYRLETRQEKYTSRKLMELKNEVKLSNAKNIVNTKFEVVNTTPHDIRSYTQGLSYYNGYVYESTGGLGFSELRKLKLETGRLIKANKVPDGYFAEGLTVFKNQLVQLTLKKNVAFIYDIKELKVVEKFRFTGDGWGIVSLGEDLLISDGSAWLQRVSSDNHQFIKRLRVTANGVDVEGINEMEYINGMIYANIWPTDCIAVVNPEKFNVEAWLDLSLLYPQNKRLSESSVLNGIAYDDENNNLLVTGKNWPVIYHLKLND